MNLKMPTRFPRLAALLLAISTASIGRAAEYWWVGGTSLGGDGTSWSDVKNWATDEERINVATAAPGESDTANFTVAGSVPQFTEAVTIGSINITEDITIDFLMAKRQL